MTSSTPALATAVPKRLPASLAVGEGIANGPGLRRADGAGAEQTSTSADIVVAKNPTDHKQTNKAAGRYR